MAKASTNITLDESTFKDVEELRKHEIKGVVLNKSLMIDILLKEAIEARKNKKKKQ